MYRTVAGVYRTSSHTLGLHSHMVSNDHFKMDHLSRDFYSGCDVFCLKMLEVCLNLSSCTSTLLLHNELGTCWELVLMCLATKSSLKGLLFYQVCVNKAITALVTFAVKLLLIVLFIAAINYNTLLCMYPLT